MMGYLSNVAVGLNVGAVKTNQTTNTKEMVNVAKISGVRVINMVGTEVPAQVKFNFVSKKGEAVDYYFGYSVFGGRQLSVRRVKDKQVLSTVAVTDVKEFLAAMRKTEAEGFDVLAKTVGALKYDKARNSAEVKTCKCARCGKPVSTREVDYVQRNYEKLGMTSFEPVCGDCQGNGDKLKNWKSNKQGKNVTRHNDTISSSTGVKSVDSALGTGVTISSDIHESVTNISTETEPEKAPESPVMVTDGSVNEVAQGQGDVEVLIAHMQKLSSMATELLGKRGCKTIATKLASEVASMAESLGIKEHIETKSVQDVTAELYAESVEQTVTDMEPINESEGRSEQASEVSDATLVESAKGSAGADMTTTVDNSSASALDGVACFDCGAVSDIHPDFGRCPSCLEGYLNRA